MKMNSKDFALLAVTVLLNVAGQLAMKRGMMTVGVVTFEFDRSPLHVQRCEGAEVRR